MAADLSIVEAVLLGVLQGLTEWLPVSSSAHLVLAHEVAGLEAPVFFDLVLHLGTLLVVIVFFRATLRDLLAALARGVGRVRRGESVRTAIWGDPETRLGLLVVLATVPTAIIGFLLADLAVALTESVLSVGIALLAAGTYIWLTKYFQGTRRASELRVRDALVVGTAQGLAAVVHGLSRSGITISAATFLGVERETAVRFSFLLSIPAILGATVLTAQDGAVAEASANWVPYAAGFLAALAVGYATLALLVAIMRRRAFHWFAIYCWSVGAMAVLWAVR